MHDVTIVMVKSFEVNSLLLYIDDDQSNLRALLLSVDSTDHVSIMCTCSVCIVYVCVCVCVCVLVLGRMYIFHIRRFYY